ncbi:MAG: dual specificity protein phosphatase family protein [Parcubacteria group bacterium]|nr:dual specificity protein phosphatase family protein [Parcubacteria group bacterium]
MIDISKITDYLYLGSQPELEGYEYLYNIGTKLIINMRLSHPFLRDVAPVPIEILRLRTFDAPLFPIPVMALVHGVETAFPYAKNGGKVFTHCKAGVHRSVAMASCILIGMGYKAGEAMKTVMQGRSVADPHAWYIEQQIRRFEEYWNKQKQENREVSNS